MQEQAKSHKFFVAAQIGMLLLFPALTFGMLYLRNFSKEELISDTIMAGIAGGVVVYLQFHMMLDHRYGYDNELHWKRFYLILLGGLAAALMFPFLPVAGWPYRVYSFVYVWQSGFRMCQRYDAFDAFGAFDSGNRLSCIFPLFSVRIDRGDFIQRNRF